MIPIHPGDNQNCRSSQGEHESTIWSTRQPGAFGSALDVRQTNRNRRVNCLIESIALSHLKTPYTEGASIMAYKTIKIVGTVGIQPKD